MSWEAWGDDDAGQYDHLLEAGWLTDDDAKELVDALKAAIKIANEARLEWDRAPQGMKAGKLLIALAGGCKGYRADIDAIHEVIARHTPVDKPLSNPERGASK